MDFDRFLDFTKVIRMIYGLDAATKFFEKNIKNYDKLIDIKSLTIYNNSNK